MRFTWLICYPHGFLEHRSLSRDSRTDREKRLRSLPPTIFCTISTAPPEYPWLGTLHSKRIQSELSKKMPEKCALHPSIFWTLHTYWNTNLFQTIITPCRTTIHYFFSGQELQRHPVVPNGVSTRVILVPFRTTNVLHFPYTTTVLF